MSRPSLQSKFRFFDEFWSGAGPMPILFARPHLARGRNYLRYDLVEQHRDVQRLLADSLLAVEPHLDLADDGIPTVRPDLGTTLLPSGLGLPFQVQPDLHPWLTGHLSVQEYLDLPTAITWQTLQRGELPMAERFYRLIREGRQQGKVPPEVHPYLPDTQGIFDLTHLAVGTEALTLPLERPAELHRLQERSLELFLTVTRHFKGLLGEPDHSMVHGHGMPAGVWFPDTGARISEDSATLLSGDMIREFCLPYIRAALAPFGRGFLHYCGHHEDFLREVCQEPLISTINLGNPEAYEMEELFALLGGTGTVCFNHFEPLAGEDGESYLERLAEAARRHRARLILISGWQPSGAEEKARLVARWHRLTAP